MKVRTLAAALGALALVATLGVFTPADAGGDGSVIVAVEKVVDGPVPEGTVFEVEVDCSPTNGVPDAAPAANGAVTMKFDANGDPLIEDSNLVFTGAFTTCTVTETVTGGATVSYACDVSGLANGTGEPEAVADVMCADDQTAVFGAVGEAEGRFTVTNTFEPEPESDAAPDSAVRPPGVVAARPTFTG